MIAAGLVVVAGLAGLTGYPGYRAQEVRESQTPHDQFLRAARQAAINLTTISYTEVDADIKRILTRRPAPSAMTSRSDLSRSWRW